MKSVYGLPVALIGALVCAWAVLSCETTTTLDTVITVTPASAQLSGKGATQTFTASVSTNSTLLLPLSWTVSDANLGHILNSVGASAVYETTTDAPGNNTIVVTDKAGQQGLAVVNQVVASQAAVSP